MRPRVVITGAGVVSPLAPTLAGTCDALARGMSAVAPATAGGASEGGVGAAARVRDFDPRPSFATPKAIKMADRAAQFAVVAARGALDASRWPGGGETRPLGVLMGTSGHDLLLPDIAAAIGVDPGQRAVHDTAWCGERLMAGLPPLWLVTVLPNMISAHVAMQMSASGPCSTLMSSEAAGLQAIGEAADWIWNGDADVVLAGGADSAVNPFVHEAWFQAGVTTIPGEGAAAFVIERRDHAVARGADILAEVVAYASAGSGRAACDRAVASVCAAGLVTRDQLRWTVGDVAYPGVRHVTVEDVVPQIGHTLAASVPIMMAVTMAASVSPDQPPAALVAMCGTTGPSVAMALRFGPGLEGGHE